jgi:hypothetical protein
MVSIINTVVAISTISNVLLFTNNMAVKVDIKIRARYSAIKKIENIVP